MFYFQFVSHLLHLSGGEKTHVIEVSKTHKVCIPKFIPIPFWFFYLFFIMAVLVLHTTSAMAINI